MLQVGRRSNSSSTGGHASSRRGRANSWGLYDMLGNVWEWCEDVWESDYTQKSRSGGRSGSGVSPPRDPGRLVVSTSRRTCAAFRYHDEPSYRNDYLGFRCAEFRQGVVSEARRGSEAKGAEHP